MPRLLLRADDAGCTRGTNDAILACLRGGLVRNIGLMACAPAFDHAVACFRDLPSQIALGLHGTVTSEWASSLRWGPVLPRDQVPTLLADDGHFVSSTQTLHEQADHDQILAEIRAQIDKARSAGLHLTYLDTHMNFTWLPGMQARLEALAAAEGLIMDPAEPDSIQSLSANPLDTFLERAAQLPSGTTHRTIFHPSTLDSDALLMVADDAEDPAAAARQRAAETAFLTDPHTSAALNGPQIDLITYAQLQNPMRSYPNILTQKPLSDP